MNQVILSGNLTREPELRTTQGGTQVANFTIAVNTGFGDKKETYFAAVVAWGKLAETCSAYLTKGSKVLLSGRLRREEYTTKNGEKRDKTTIVATGIEFLGQPQQKTDYGSRLPAATPAPDNPYYDAHATAKANGYQPQPEMRRGEEYDNLPF